MIRHAAALAPAALVLAAWPALAEAPAHAPLYEALELPRVVSIMRDEGVGYGVDLAEQMFPAAAGESWRASVERIYDEAAMLSRLQAGLDEALAKTDVPAMTGFFASDLGRRIVGLELSAREAMADDGVDAAARAGWEAILAEDGARAELIERFVEVNDLVEENVVGGLNSNFAFMRGLNAGGAFERALPEGEILADVWGSEPQIRDETAEWVFGYLSMAYSPLSDDELEAYVEFSDTEAGRELNRALFEAFDAMYDGMSYDLGRAAAGRMAGEAL